MIVADAGAVVLLFVDPAHDPRVKAARAALARDPAWLVPEHWKTDLISSVRGLWLGRKLSDERAQRAVEAILRMAVNVVPIDSLLPRMWELRGNVTAYDAAYIAAAEAHDCAVVTTDGRLARAGRGRCPIDVIR
ncbi:type II toxin-antitoxin system VapC family toxin [Streptomyces sp. 6N223]|uniref:type II toxin-antitoxin system VapC family toxin n=1 Tax=Streptomyces sp. 6N223 TaxID=3457412 RepID=UPI003FD65D7B